MRRLVQRIMLAYELLREYEREQAAPRMSGKECVDLLLEYAATLPDANRNAAVVWKRAVQARAGEYRGSGGTS